MKPHRFPFTVVQVDDGIAITMNCGSGIYRARNVPADFLRKLVDACQQAQATILGLRRSKSQALASLPAFPNCRLIAETNLGPCAMRITATRGIPKDDFHIAFYDADDQAAPALLLIDEQIEQFISQATGVLADIEASTESPTEATDVPQQRSA
jgi:hypothetical protein